MKTHKKLSLLLLALCLAMLFVSCDNVYYSAVSGYVQDSSGSGISGVNVYAYTSQSQRDSVYNSYVAGKDFDDPKCLFRATTQANGAFSIGRVVWKTSKSEWGKEYASTTLYFIFFSKDYGIQKQDGVNIISGSSNASSLTVDMGNKVRTNCTVTLRFKDWSDLTQTKSRDLVASPLSFSYTYNDGYGDVKENASTTNGTFTITVPVLQDEDGTINSEVTISNIKQSDGYWTVRNSETKKADTTASYTFKIDSTTTTGDIMLRREKWNLGQGVSGSVTVMPRGVSESKIVLNNSVVTGKLNGEEYNVTVSSSDEPSEFGSIVTGSFSGLFANAEVTVTYANNDQPNEKPNDIQATDIKLNVKKLSDSTLLTQDPASPSYTFKKDGATFDAIQFVINGEKITCTSPSIGE